MARNPLRDERQGDLFGAPPQPAKPARRAAPPISMRKETPAPEPMSLGNLGARAARPEIDAFLDGLPDQELAYLVVEATRLVKRRLARGQGRGLRSRGPGRGQSPLAEVPHRLGAELMEFDEPDETW